MFTCSSPPVRAVKAQQTYFSVNKECGFFHRNNIIGIGMMLCK